MSRRRKAIVYQSGNDTVIQPVGKKEIVGFQTLLNIIIGVVIGVGVAWYLVGAGKSTACTESGE